MAQEGLELLRDMKLLTLRNARKVFVQEILGQHLDRDLRG
jgi:hypothetical protein